MVGTANYGVNILSPQSGSATGYRRVPQLGNTNHNLTWTIGLNRLPQAVYYWSVQAVDTAFAGSLFATESTFNGPQLALNNPAVMSGSDSLVWGNDFYDEIVNYQIQIDDDSNFGSPEIDEAVNPGSACSVALNQFADYGNLIAGTYFWRIKPVYTNGLDTVFTWENIPSFVYQDGVTVGIQVNLQGANRPSQGWQVPIIVGFFTPGADVLVDAPLYSFSGTTTAISTQGGTRAYFLCPDPIEAGTYDITADSSTTLLNVKRNVNIQ